MTLFAIGAHVEPFEDRLAAGAPGRSGVSGEELSLLGREVSRLLVCRLGDGLLQHVAQYLIEAARVTRRVGECSWDSSVPVRPLPSRIGGRWVDVTPVSGLPFRDQPSRRARGPSNWPKSVVYSIARQGNVT
jgi:hypothetical protein